MTLTEICHVLETRGLRPLRQFGQNFLHDQNLCEWLVETGTAGLAPGATILEIGPGLGALTEGLLQKGLTVVAMEKDRGLAEFLRERFPDRDKLQLIEGDALETLEQNRTTQWTHVIGNLPYNISTPLLMTLIGRPHPPDAMLFTLQREMVARLAASPRSKEYSSLTVLVAAEYAVAPLRVFPASVFFPVPEVESAVVQITRLPKPHVPVELRRQFHAIVKRGFAQRRKKLSNLLPTKDGRRAEELDLAAWLVLFEEVRAAQLVQASSE